MDCYAVNRLVQELFSTPGNLALLQEDRSALYDRYGLDAKQRAALDAGDRNALAGAGVHPILQMHYAMAVNPEMTKMISVRRFLEDDQRA
ncbi:subunit of meta cleavage enzyme [Pseudoxanthomonas spadix BD-a59]|uniref:Subunit of meta cleavage enzyme n=1 Tax=Pseudoxanthomonas spadix (strain BD-a59) TaxID=1045855 RepID=G7UUT6_PSEUP|nr:subunit of meta cleavage enzyme [Pseudoxanthomonas spadix]AER57559.1 subunit of meta cleavage enzyme [Pseudoxanthomonas spadix BD-a59]